MRYKIGFELELKKNPYDGLYIALEGTEASGKTTQVQELKKYFKGKGKEVVTTREPRKEGLIGDLIHKVLKGEQKFPALALQYLFTTDRVLNHEEVVKPALEKGKIVISDRCFWSAIVYGILDRMGEAYDVKTTDYLLIAHSILSHYHQFIIPDFTFYLKIPLNDYELEEFIKTFSKNEQGQYIEQWVKTGAKCETVHEGQHNIPAVASIDWYGVTHEDSVLVCVEDIRSTYRSIVNDARLQGLSPTLTINGKEIPRIPKEEQI